MVLDMGMSLRLGQGAGQVEAVLGLELQGPAGDAGDVGPISGAAHHPPLSGREAVLSQEGDDGALERRAAALAGRHAASSTAR